MRQWSLRATPERKCHGARHPSPPARPLPHASLPHRGSGSFAQPGKYIPATTARNPRPDSGTAAHRQAVGGGAPVLGHRVAPDPLAAEHEDDVGRDPRGRRPRPAPVAEAKRFPYTCGVTSEDWEDPRRSQSECWRSLTLLMRALGHSRFRTPIESTLRPSRWRGQGHERRGSRTAGLAMCSDSGAPPSRTGRQDIGPELSHANATDPRSKKESSHKTTKPARDQPSTTSAGFDPVLASTRARAPPFNGPVGTGSVAGVCDADRSCH